MESRLCESLVKFMVGSQARATEVCDGALWAGDISFHSYGILLHEVLNKTRKHTLDPLARVALRLPVHMASHDPTPALVRHLWMDGGWGAGTVKDDTPVFRSIEVVGGRQQLSARPLPASEAKSLIMKHMALAGVSFSTDLFSWNMHFGRATGFNLLHNVLHLDRHLVAAAGGWKYSDVIAKHYHEATPLELAVDVRLAFLKLRFLGWTLPA